MQGITFRRGTADDAKALARHRCEMFREMGVLAAESYTDLFEASADYFRQTVPEGTYLAWLALNGETVVGGGGMLLNTVPPRPGPSGKWIPSNSLGLILNVFVEETWRRQGIAEALMQLMIDYAREQGIPSLSLHASKQGRPLYERLGFQQTNEMRLFVSENLAV